MSFFNLLGNVISGDLFNELNASTKLLLFRNHEQEQDKILKFQNLDIINEKVCNGMIFIDELILNNISRSHLNQVDALPGFYSTVEVPSDAQVYINLDGTYVSDKLIVYKSQDIRDLSVWSNINSVTHFIKFDARFINYVNISILDEYAIIHLIKTNSIILKFINPKLLTKHIWLISVADNINLIKDTPIEYQDEELWVNTLKKNINMFEHCKLRTNTILKLALSTPFNENIKHIEPEHITQELAEISVKAHYINLQNFDTKFQTYNMCLEACKTNGSSIEYVINKFLTQELCNIAVQSNAFAFKHVPEKFRTEEMTIFAVNSQLHNFTHVINPSDKIITAVLKKSPGAIGYIKKYTTRILIEAVMYHTPAYSYITFDPDPDLVMMLLIVNPEIDELIPDDLVEKLKCLDDYRILELAINESLASRGLSDDWKILNERFVNYDSLEDNYYSKFSDLENYNNYNNYNNNNNNNNNYNNYNNNNNYNNYKNITNEDVTNKTNQELLDNDKLWSAYM